MFNQLSLFIILLAPVMTYLAGACCYRVIHLCCKDTALVKSLKTRIYQKGL
jgi:hypothetical protein